MIPYMTLTLSIEQTNFQKIHSDVYQLIKREVPDTVFNKLISGDYRNLSYINYKFLQEQTSLYINRPLYILFIYAFYKIGIDLVLSTYLISLLSGFLTSVLIYFWLLKFYKAKYSFVITVILIFSTGLREVAKYSTPDGLSIILMIATVYLLMNKKNKNFPLILLLFSQLARPDNIIFVIVLSIFLYKTSLKDFSINKKQFYILSILSILLFIPNLFNVFLHLFFGERLNNYINILSSSIKLLISMPYFSLYLLLSVLIYKNVPRTKGLKITISLLNAALITMVIRFLIFPSVEIRFYSFYFLVIAILFIICSNNISIKSPTSFEVKQLGYSNLE